MSAGAPPPTAAPPPSGLLGPLRFVLRGLAISLPAVLTIVIVLWALRGINSYIVFPATSAVKWVLAQGLDESVDTQPLVRLPSGPELEGTGFNYLVTPLVQQSYATELGKLPAGASNITELADWLANQNGVFVPYGRRSVPYQHYLIVAQELYPDDMPRSATGLYMEYAAQRSFGSVFQLSLVAIVLIVAILYFLGRLVTIRIGHWIVHQFETKLLGRLPLIRSVYGSVKQVTDFLFSEAQVEYRRVVAVEYPRRGIWSLGFVTSDSFLELAGAVGEPCVTVLVPSSPMPMTGYTMSLPRSHVLDLNVNVEQAMNFCISCGVLVPPHQRVTPELLRQHLEKRLAAGFQSSGATRARPWRGDGDEDRPSAGDARWDDDGPAPSSRRPS